MVKYRGKLNDGNVFSGVVHETSDVGVAGGKIIQALNGKGVQASSIAALSLKVAESNNTLKIREARARTPRPASAKRATGKSASTRA